MELIKKIKQNGIVFVGLGLGILGFDGLIEFTEPIKSTVEKAGLILLAFPFPFYVYDWIKALIKNK
jgi:hypothetical protein